jgi:phosphoserine phosphatase RsbU/P
MNITSEQKCTLLLEISQKTHDTLDLNQIIVHLLDIIQSVVQYDAAGIFVLNRDLLQLEHSPPANIIAEVIWRGYDPVPAGKDDMFIQGKGIIGYVIHSNSSLIVPDVRLNQRYIGGREETLSEIAVPILLDDKAIGALNLESNQLNAYDKSDLNVLQFFADAAAIALEKAMLHRQLLAKELVDKQLQMAKAVQTHLLPQGEPMLPGYDIAGICVPAEEIGGDYFDYLTLPGGTLGIVVADVSGHGIPSALVMTAFRSLLRTHATLKSNPAEVASILNALLPDFTGGSHFITMVYGQIDTNNDRVAFVRCGHPSPLLLHKNGKLETLDANGPAFGIFSNVGYVNENMTLSAGDILVMYTDGVIELENQTGEAFGFDRLKNLVSHYKELAAKDLIRKVVSETGAFSAFKTPLDDFTLVIIKKE